MLVDWLSPIDSSLVANPTQPDLTCLSKSWPILMQVSLGETQKIQQGRWIGMVVDVGGLSQSDQFKSGCCADSTRFNPSLQMSAYHTWQKQNKGWWIDLVLLYQFNPSTYPPYPLFATHCNYCAKFGRAFVLLKQCTHNNFIMFVGILTRLILDTWCLVNINLAKWAVKEGNKTVI